MNIRKLVESKLFLEIDNLDQDIDYEPYISNELDYDEDPESQSISNLSVVVENQIVGCMCLIRWYHRNSDRMIEIFRYKKLPSTQIKNLISEIEKTHSRLDILDVLDKYKFNTTDARKRLK